MAPFPHQIFFAHQRPIPECYNEPLEKALKSSFDYIWMVEEDMKLPEGILQELLDLGKPIAISDYAAVEGVMCVTRNAEGGIMYAGTGCLLVERGVFELMNKPVFDATNAYSADGRYMGKHDPREPIYGQHDIHFYHQVNEMGIPIGLTKSICNQRKLVERGQFETNTGFHKIKII